MQQQLSIREIIKDFNYSVMEKDYSLFLGEAVEHGKLPVYDGTQQQLIFE